MMEASGYITVSMISALITSPIHETLARAVEMTVEAHKSHVQHLSCCMSGFVHTGLMRYEGARRLNLEQTLYTSNGLKIK
jgi:hypothetical protein